MDLRITIEPAYDAPDDVRSLFAAYTDGLLVLDPGVRRHLSAQHYGDELRDPAAKYGPPDGRLYLARAWFPTTWRIPTKGLGERDTISITLPSILLVSVFSLVTATLTVSPLRAPIVLDAFTNTSSSRSSTMTKI